MADSLAKSYVAMILVIILWVAVWSLAEAVGGIYLRTHTDKIRFYGGVACATSLILIMFFPQHMFL